MLPHSAVSWPAQAGWFGKIPALGDFAGRRLPAGFVSTWDHWLSDGLRAAQQALGARWLESYNSAPLWRFALTPGLIDEQYWGGVLMANVDRVGRQFPLTIAAPAPQAACIHRRRLEAWIVAALRARRPDCDPDVLETALAAAAEAEQLGARSDTSDAADTADIADTGRDALREALAAAGPGISLWWPWRAGGANEHETVRSVDGLPRADQFVRLFGGG